MRYNSRVDSSCSVVKESSSLGRRVFHGDDVAILKSEVVPKNTGAAFELRKGQRPRVAGKSLVDFVAFDPESSS
jgi:uncharacterized protein YcgI (DUF1989 family)